MTISYTLLRKQKSTESNTSMTLPLILKILPASMEVGWGCHNKRAQDERLKQLKFIVFPSIVTWRLRLQYEFGFGGAQFSP
jgi:hypothetical protein